MPEKTKIQRIVLRVMPTEDGNWVIQQCKDSWLTLPFKWPTQSSAMRDMSIIVSGLEKKGYTVIPPEDDSKEVKPD